MSQNVEEDESGQINEMRSENREKQKEGEEKTIGDFGLFLALNFRAEPEEQSRPEDKHDSRSPRAGDIEEGRG